MGQLEGQRACRGPPAHHAPGRAAAVATAEDLWGFTPGIDAASMRHARLEARLFRS
jgi:urease accessory protein UreF